MHIDLIALPKDEYIHKEAREHVAVMVKLHQHVCATIEKINEALKKRL